MPHFPPVPFICSLFSLSLIHSVLFKLYVFLYFLVSLFASDRNMKKREKKQKSIFASCSSSPLPSYAYKNIFFSTIQENCTFEFNDWVSWALWKCTVTETVCVNLLRLAYFQRSNRFHFCNIFFRYDFSEQFSIKFLCGFYFMEWINRCTYDRCTCEYGFVHKTSLRSRHVQLTTKTALNWIIFVIIGI